MAFLKNLNFNKLKENVEAGVKSAQENIGAGVKSAQENISNFKVDDAVKGAKDAAASGITMIGDKLEGLSKQEPEDGTISIKDFITIMWFLASVDGAVSPEEEQRVASIARDLDESYAGYSEELHDECIARLQESVRDYGAQNAAKVEAGKVIDEGRLSTGEAKMLCWNLLAVANADGLDQNEIDFMEFIARKMSVDKAVFEELRSYSDAIVDLELAQNQLKSSNRSYAEVEPLMTEYAKRERVILDAAQALVTDK